jgi:hypothetical protein
VDALRGPLILELNARPGLAIQVANRQGLMKRLEAIERDWRPGADLGERLQMGRRLAAADAAIEGRPQ